MNGWWPVLLPELRRFPATERDGVFRCARDTAPDLVELIGMAAALVLVMVLTRYGLPDADISTRLGGVLINLAVAVPLLIVFLGPFHLRRLRRGLRDQLHEQGQP